MIKHQLFVPTAPHVISRYPPSVFKQYKKSPAMFTGGTGLQGYIVMSLFAWLLSCLICSCCFCQSPNHAIIVYTGLTRSIINTALITVSAMISIQGFVISKTHITPCLSCWDIQQKICYKACSLLAVACWPTEHTTTLTLMIQ